MNAKPVRLIKKTKISATKIWDTKRIKWMI
jgi:hypothetical protein